MGTVSSIVDAVSPREDRTTAKAQLFELDQNDLPKKGQVSTFQYFPETISDNRGVEYISKRGVGASHPIYQWVACSDRTISFEATFTSEVDPGTDNSSILGSAAAISNILKNPLNAAAGAAMSASGVRDDSGYTVDVAAAIAWLRSKTYPDYPKSAPVAPPPKLLLYLPNSHIFSGVAAAGLNLKDIIPCIMTECNVTYEAFFRSGRPKIVQVSLSFNEIIQIGDNWGYVGKSAADQSWLGQNPYRPIAGKQPDFNPSKASSSSVISVTGNGKGGLP